MSPAGAPPRLFDPCVEFGALSPAELSELARFGLAGLLLVPPAGAGPLGEPPIERLAALIEAARTGLQRARLEGLHAVGLGPGEAGRSHTRPALARLPELLSQPHVRVVGRLGLGEGSAEEEALLLAQLELARELQRPTLIEVMPAQVKRLAQLVRGEARALLLCRDEASVRLLRGLGLSCALRVGKGAISPNLAVRLVRALGPSGLCLASAAAPGGGDLLALPHVAMRLSAAGLGEDVIRRVGLDNPRAWLGLPAELPQV